MQPVVTIAAVAAISFALAACSSGPQEPEPPLERPQSTASAARADA